MTNKHVVSITFTLMVCMIEWMFPIFVMMWTYLTLLPFSWTTSYQLLLMRALIRLIFSSLVGRFLCKYIPIFKDYGKGLERHILHQHSIEMSQKSEVVSSELNWCA